jgi:hypothetical protein
MKFLGASREVLRPDQVLKMCGLDEIRRFLIAGAQLGASDLVPPKQETTKNAKSAKSLPDEAFYRSTRSVIWI